MSESLITDVQRRLAARKRRKVQHRLLALRDRHIKATGALEALTQHAEQVLALCEAYPDNEPLQQLLEHVEAQIVARCRQQQATTVQITPFD